HPARYVQGRRAPRPAGLQSRRRRGLARRSRGGEPRERVRSLGDGGLQRERDYSVGRTADDGGRATDEPRPPEPLGSNTQPPAGYSAGGCVFAGRNTGEPGTGIPEQRKKVTGSRISGMPVPGYPLTTPFLPSAPACPQRPTAPGTRSAALGRSSSS